MSSLLETKFKISGMDCASCAGKIDTAVRRIKGVGDVSVSVATGTMTVRHGDVANIPQVERQVKGLGYNLVVVQPVISVSSTNAQASKPTDVSRPSCCDHSGHADNDQVHEGPLQLGHGHGPIEAGWWKSGKGRLTILSGLALAVAYLMGHLFPAIASAAFAVAMLVGLVPIGRRAMMAALAGTPFSIEMLMTIAALGAFAINATEEAATVVFLFLVGEMLEGVAASRARAGIRSLTSLIPKTALLEDNGETRPVPAETVPVGAVILVRPGDRIAADGIILSGESAIDEAPVTGESTPAQKGAGDPVFAGTINGDAALQVKVTAAAADNTIARVVKLVEEAQESKAPTERFIDRFSRFYTPAIVVVAALVAFLPPLLLAASWSEWIYKGLAILLIGCPCALVISTPAAIAAALSSGAHRGLLIKGGAVLENLGRVNTIAFDKTGTLTEGRPVVTDLVGFTLPEADVLRLAVALETGSSHPLALAILQRATETQIVVPALSGGKALAGRGIAGNVEGKALFFGSAVAAAERSLLSEDQQAVVARLNDAGKSVSVLVVDGVAAGVIAMRDGPRADALSALTALARRKIRTIMLTGDNKRTATAVAGGLGIEVHAELLPEDKQKIVSGLKRDGLVVAKVGDGINDAPALAAADVGIAMGGGTDVALETADAAILHGRVGDVWRMIDLSRRTMRNIRQNIGIALGLKAVFLVTTVVGITGLWPAILADTGATVLVTLNALRLLREPKC